MIWEGSELCFHYDGESRTLRLSDVQFVMIARLLGLEISSDGEVSCYSDETLRQLAHMRGNPLRLKEKV